VWIVGLLSLVALVGCREDADSSGLRLREQRIDPALIVDAGTMRVREGGSPLALTLNLPIDATSPVNIAITGSADLDFPVSTTQLQATTDDGIIPVVAVDDADVEGLETGLITLTLSSADVEFDGKVIEVGPIAIIDNDLPWVEYAHPGGVSEGDAAGATTAVQLGVDPVSQVEVAFVTADGQVAVMPSNRTISTDSWQNAFNVTFTAVDDAVREGDHEGRVQIRLTDTQMPPRWPVTVIDEVRLPITDNDPPGLEFPDGVAVTLTEGDAAYTHRVRLAQPPTGPVQVEVASTSDVNVSPSRLTFTTGNWSVAQSFEVRAVDDAVDEADEEVGLSYQVTSDDGGYDGLAVSGLRVTVVDNDTAGFVVTEAGPSTAVTEGGPSDLYSIQLTSQPRATVRVDAVAPAALLLSPSSLTFGPGDWSSPKIMEVSAVDNTAIAAMNPTVYTITHTVVSQSSQYQDLTPRSIAVSVTDDDSAAILSTAGSSLTLVEGRSEVFEVRLSAQPAGNPEMTLRSSDPRLEVSPATRTISRADWSSPIGVTLTAVENAVDEPDIAATVTITVAGGGFDAPPLTLSVDVKDNDDVDVIAADVEVREVDVGSNIPQAFVTVPLRLSTASTRPIAVSWETVDGSALAVADYVVGSGVVTFAPGQTEGSLIVDVVSDNVTEPSESFGVALSTTSEGVTLRQEVVTCTITDDDASPVASTVTLRTAPGVPVMGTLRGSDADGDALTYTIVEPPTRGTLQLLDAGLGTFSYTPDATAEGQDLMRYVASDGANTSSPAFVTVEIGEPTGEVAVSVFAPPSADEGSLVRLEAIPTGADPATATYRWDLDGDGAFEDGFDGSVEVRAPGDADSWVVQVRLTDGAAGAMAEATIELHNLAPILSGANSVDGFEGSGVLLEVEAVDPGGDALQFAWDFDDGETLEGESIPRVVHAFGGEGFYNVGLTVTDDSGASSTFDIFVPVSNVAPTLAARPIRRAVARMPYAFDALAFDPGDDTLEWQLNGPPNFTLEVCEDQGPWQCRRVMGTGLTAQALAAGISLGLEVTDGAATASASWRVEEREIDSDGGGADNTCEVRYGLDPSSAVDDMADPDGDGLATWRECASGSDALVSNAPTAPTPIFPVGGELQSGFPIALLVGNADDVDEDALLYAFELVDDADRTVSIVEGVPGQPNQTWAYLSPSSLREDAIYRWSSRASDAWAFGPTSEAEAFLYSSRNDAPPAPEPLAPRGAVSGPLQFEAAPVVDPEGDSVTYEFEAFPVVGSGTVRSGAVAADEGALTWTLSAPLPSVGAWMWRVRAVDAWGAASAFSPFVEFTPGLPVGDLPVPALESPIDDARVATAADVLLVWSNVTLDDDSPTYNVELRLADETPVASESGVVPDDGASTSWSAGRLVVGTYQWRVQTSDGAVVSAFSAWADFEVVDGPVVAAPPKGVQTEFGCQTVPGGWSGGVWVLLVLASLIVGRALTPQPPLP